MLEAGAYVNVPISHTFFTYWPISSNLHTLTSPTRSPKETDADEESYPEEEIDNLYKEAFADLSIDQEESQDLVDFFSKCPKSKIIATR